MLSENVGHCIREIRRVFPLVCNEWENSFQVHCNTKSQIPCCKELSNSWNFRWASFNGFVGQLIWLHSHPWGIKVSQNLCAFDHFIGTVYLGYQSGLFKATSFYSFTLCWCCSVTSMMSLWHLEKVSCVVFVTVRLIWSSWLNWFDKWLSSCCSIAFYIVTIWLFPISSLWSSFAAIWDGISVFSIYWILEISALFQISNIVSGSKAIEIIFYCDSPFA